MGTVKDAVARDRERRAWELRTREGKSIYTIAAALGVTPQAVSLMLKRVGKAIHKQLAEAVEAQKAEQAEQYDLIIEESIAAWKRSQLNAEKATTRTKELGARKVTQEPQEHGGSLTRTRRGSLVVEDEEEFDAEDIEGGLYLDEDGEEIPAEERARRIAANAAQKANEKADDELTIVERITVAETKGQTGDPRFLEQANKALDAKREIWGLNAPKSDMPTAQAIVKVYMGVDVSEEV